MIYIYRYVANHKGILFPKRATQALTSAFISSQRKGPQENSPTSLDTSCHDNVPQAIRWGFSTSPATPRSEWMRGRFTGLPGKRRLLDIDHWRFCGRNPKLIKGHLLYKMVLSIGCEPKSLLIGNGCLSTQLSIWQLCLWSSRYQWIVSGHGGSSFWKIWPSGRDQLLTQLQPRPTRWGLDRDSTDKNFEKLKLLPKQKNPKSAFALLLNSRMS